MAIEAVEVRDLLVVRGGREVLRQLDISIGGGVTGLLGPSGCGKTTLLRQIAGFDKLDAGRISIGDVRAGSVKRG